MCGVHEECALRFFSVNATAAHAWQGVTTLMLTKIPFFREVWLPQTRRRCSPDAQNQVVLMAFECQHCGFRSSEVQMGGQIPDKGVRFELSVPAGDEKARARAAPSPLQTLRPRRSLSRGRW